MKRKNLLSGKDRRMADLAEQFETALAEHTSRYMDADDLADLADWYSMRGKSDMAQAVVKLALRLHPGNTAVMVEQAYLFIDMQRDNEAWEVVQNIQEDYLPEVVILKAYLLMLQGEDEKAELLIDSVEDKDDLANIIDIAYLYMDMNELVKAEEWVDRGEAEYADDESYLALKADFLYAARRLNEAADYFNEIIDINPYSAPYWYGLARCYYDLEDYGKAIEACDYANLSDEEYGDAYLLRGHAYFYLGNLDKAIENYRQAVRYGVVSESYYNAFAGMEKTAQGEWEEGCRYLLQALKKPDQSGFPIELIYSNLALCHYEMGDVRKARSYCHKAQKANPKFADSYVVEGRIFMDEDNVDEAGRMWETALRYDNSAEVWHDIGMSCLKAGHWEMATQAFEEVRSQEPNYPYINEKLAGLSLVMLDKERFEKYNRLSRNPMSQQMARQIEEAVKTDNSEKMLEIMRRIIGERDD